MPDSSLRVILYSFLLLIFSSACRSRMTAEVKCVLQMKLNGSCHKRKNINRKLSPDTGKVSAELTKGASWSRNERIEISVSKTGKILK